MQVVNTLKARDPKKETRETTNNENSQKLCTRLKYGSDDHYILSPQSPGLPQKITIRLLNQSLHICFLNVQTYNEIDKSN